MDERGRGRLRGSLLAVHGDVEESLRRRSIGAPGHRQRECEGGLADGPELDVLHPGAAGGDRLNGPAIRQGDDVHGTVGPVDDLVSVPRRERHRAQAGHRAETRPPRGEPARPVRVRRDRRAEGDRGGRHDGRRRVRVRGPAGSGHHDGDAGECTSDHAGLPENLIGTILRIRVGGQAAGCTLGCHADESRRGAKNDFMH